MKNLRLTPLHQAVINNRHDLIRQLCFSEFYDKVDSYGLTPVELARLLGHRQCEVLLNQEFGDVQFQVKLQGLVELSSLTLLNFEKKFQMIFRPFLKFPSYQILQDVVKNCPYFFRLETLLAGSSELEVQCQAKLSKGSFANTYLRWINSNLGYGLFAGEDLFEKTFIGEYTGIVRKIDKSSPNLNGYCFHYPTRFWSKNYYVIDAFHEGNLSRFINHSSNPNLQPLWLLNRGILHLVFITDQFIPKGGELTFNYGPDYWLKRKVLRA